MSVVSKQRVTSLVYTPGLLCTITTPERGHDVADGLAQCDAKGKAWRTDAEGSSTRGEATRARFSHARARSPRTVMVCIREDAWRTFERTGWSVQRTRRRESKRGTGRIQSCANVYTHGMIEKTRLWFAACSGNGGTETVATSNLYFSTILFGD